jgi:predicted ATPase/predicted Ser/Thr protein kinase
MGGDGQTVLGDFRLERLIARGGMSLVYEAREITANRRVALKLISPQASTDSEQRERFVRGARAALALQHENIVPVYSVGEAGGRPFLAMRLIDGEDLKQIIDGEGRLPVERVLRIAGQIAGALDAAHAAGVVHRDLKPANVMVEQPGDADEHCYVVDFGLAAAQDASSIMGGGRWTGTPAYVSPEQLRGERLDARTDVYALGALVFHALAGSPPYAREHVSGTLLAHLHAPPPSLAELRGDVPWALNDVIARAMAKTPDARYASAGELARALDRALAGGSPVSAPGPHRGTGPARPRLGNLPADTPALIGRRTELDTARAALGEGRLLSVVGAGGVGKTALALRLAGSVAGEYGGAWVVELEASRDTAGLELAMARALGLQIGLLGSVHSALVEFIGERRVLLVLDNCEHMLADTARTASELLAACPSLTIVATSREPLGVEDERVQPLGPLEVPSVQDDPDDVLASDSARLLLQRAAEQGLAPDSPSSTAGSIARICTALDGIPLALELAAARLRTLSLSELEHDLRDGLRVLTDAGSDGPERQRTLDGLIDWSWRLLGSDEREVLSRLAAFAGPFTLDAARAVAARPGSDAVDAGPLVLRLADKSLLQVDARREQPRFRMLQPVRQFCLAHPLDSAPPASARSAHRAYYLALVERVRPKLSSLRGAEWLLALDDDQADIRAAIESGPRDGDVECALRIGVAMHQYWACRGRAGEGIELLTAIPQAGGDGEGLRLRAKAQSVVAHLAAGLLGDARLAEPYALAALDLARAAGDLETAAEAVTWLSWSETFGGRASEALARVREALLRESSIMDPTVRGRLHDAEAIALEHLDETDAAQESYARARGLFQTSSYAPGIASVENHLGDLDLSRGDRAGASAHFSLARATAEGAGDGASVAMAALNLALIEHLDGRSESAREMFVDCLMTDQARGDRTNVAFSIFGLALTEPDDDRAAELHGNAERRLDQLNVSLSALEMRLQSEERARLRAGLGSERFDRARERGQRLRVEDVLAADLDQAPVG